MSIETLIQRFRIDLELSSQSIIGQPSVTFDCRTQPAIARLVVARYSRFGNNFFQMLHAMLIALRLEIPMIVLQDFGTIRGMPFDPELGFEVSLDKIDQGHADLYGAFYAPFGFEALIQTFDRRAVAKLMRHCLPVLYQNVLATAVPRNSIVLHFRGGDIFTTQIHPWYVQPPASFYLEALDHALAFDNYHYVQLMSEDRLNPAMLEVERRLEARGIPFVSRINDLSTDISVLLSCKCIIASYGTFVEAAALISDNLKSYYVFRAHSSQADFQPFLQSKVGPLLTAKSVRCFIVDDFSYSYIKPRCWDNSEWQRTQMISFPGEVLRIFEYFENGTLPN